MSFLTSFWLLPQKEQERLPCSRFFSISGTPRPKRGSSWYYNLPEAVWLSHVFGFKLGPLQHDLIDEAILLGLPGTHEEIALGILVDPVDGLAGMFGQNFVQRRFHFQDFLGVDLDVRHLALET